MTSELLNEIALAIDAFITLRVERDTLASELTQDELSEMALGILEITARHRATQLQALAARVKVLEAENERLREANRFLRRGLYGLIENDDADDIATTLEAKR